VSIIEESKAIQRGPYKRWISAPREWCKSMATLFEIYQDSC